MKVSGITGALFFLIYIRLQLSTGATTPCALRESSYGYVCVCNITYCDYLDLVIPSGNDDLVIVSSSKGGLRFSAKSGKFSDGSVVVKDLPDSEQENEHLYGPMVELVKKGESPAIFPATAKRSVKINVDRSKQFQKIVGFGGSFTGSVSYLLDKLPQQLQDDVYKSYYSQKGIAFSIMRIPIGGSDFDLEPWAYNEVPADDAELTGFTKLDERDEKKIEHIERLKFVASIDSIKIFGSAWSPPKWMKTNNAWTGLSFIKKTYYQTWANYHLKFLELMDAKNLPLWAITTGNEPLNGVTAWLFSHFISLGWTPGKQAIWLADNLGPTIRNSNFSDVKIFSNDDQRYTYPWWFKVMKATRKESLDFLDGFAVHWYWDEYFGPSLIDKTHKMFPDKLLFNTESCLGDKPFATHGPELGAWSRGEKYARSYLEDLQHSFNGYIDWNIILDEEGGPNYAKNYVDAPVIVNVTSGQEFYKQPIFYIIGHFSKFIPEGSIRIEAERSNVNIATVAFERPDKSISAVLFNSGSAAVDVTLTDSVRGNILITIPAGSLHTIVYN